MNYDNTTPGSPDYNPTNVQNNESTNYSGSASSQNPNYNQNEGGGQQTAGNYSTGDEQKYNQWVQHYQQGNYDQVPHGQLHQAWRQFAQQADPQQVQQATTQGYQQVPPDKRSGVAGTLLNFFQQHGLSPQAAGVQNTNPQDMTPQDMGRMTQYAHEQQPDALKQLFQPGGTLSNPLVGMALAGALAFGISRMGKGR